MLSPLILDATDDLLHLLVQLKVLALQLVNLLHQAVNPSLCLLLNIDSLHKNYLKSLSFILQSSVNLKYYLFPIAGTVMRSLLRQKVL